MARTTVRQTRQQSRERIVRAAELLVRKRAFSELTVDELMSEAGLGRTIFYRHFDDLGDLVRSLSLEAVEELFEAQQRLLAARPADVRGALLPAVRVYEEYGPLLRCAREAAAIDEDIGEGYAAMRQRFIDFAEEALRRLIGDDRYGDLGETARALNMMNEAYLTEAFGREPRVSRETAVRTLVEIWEAVIRP